MTDTDSIMKQVSQEIPISETSEVIDDSISASPTAMEIAEAGLEAGGVVESSEPTDVVLDDDVTMETEAFTPASDTVKNDTTKETADATMEAAAETKASVRTIETEADVTSSPPRCPAPRAAVLTVPAPKIASPKPAIPDINSILGIAAPKAAACSKSEAAPKLELAEVKEVKETTEPAPSPKLVLETKNPFNVENPLSLFSLSPKGLVTPMASGTLPLSPKTETKPQITMKLGLEAGTDYAFAKDLDSSVAAKLADSPDGIIELIEGDQRFAEFSISSCAPHMRSAKFLLEVLNPILEDKKLAQKCEARVFIRDYAHDLNLSEDTKQLFLSAVPVRQSLIMERMQNEALTEKQVLEVIQSPYLLEIFIKQNKIDNGCAKTLREAPDHIRDGIIKDGDLITRKPSLGVGSNASAVGDGKSMLGVKKAANNASAIIMSRITKMKEMADRIDMESFEERARKFLLEHSIDDSARKIFFQSSLLVQKAVLDEGPLIDARNNNAVLVKRVNAVSSKLGITQAGCKASLLMKGLIRPQPYNSGKGNILQHAMHQSTQHHARNKANSILNKGNSQVNDYAAGKGGQTPSVAALSSILGSSYSADSPASGTPTIRVSAATPLGKNRLASQLSSASIGAPNSTLRLNSAQSLASILGTSHSVTSQASPVGSWGGNGVNNGKGCGPNGMNNGTNNLNNTGNINNNGMNDGNWNWKGQDNSMNNGKGHDNSMCNKGDWNINGKGNDWNNGKGMNNDWNNNGKGMNNGWNNNGRGVNNDWNNYGKGMNSDWNNNGKGMNSDWNNNGKGMNSDWNNNGKGMNSDWNNNGKGMNSDWNSNGKGMNSDWNNNGGKGMNNWNDWSNGGNNATGNGPNMNGGNNMNYMNGPPQNMNGPPPNMNGPPQNMIGAPQNMDGAPPNVTLQNNLADLNVRNPSGVAALQTLWNKAWNMGRGSKTTASNVANSGTAGNNNNTAANNTNTAQNNWQSTTGNEPWSAQNLAAILGTNPANNTSNANAHGATTTGLNATTPDANLDIGSLLSSASTNTGTGAANKNITTSTNSATDDWMSELWASVTNSSPAVVGGDQSKSSISTDLSFLTGAGSPSEVSPSESLSSVLGVTVAGSANPRTISEDLKKQIEDFCGVNCLNDTVKNLLFSLPDGSIETLVTEMDPAHRYSTCLSTLTPTQDPSQNALNILTKLKESGEIGHMARCKAFSRDNELPEELANRFMSILRLPDGAEKQMKILNVVDAGVAPKGEALQAWLENKITECI